jgi:hypothetical protein
MVAAAAAAAVAVAAALVGGDAAQSREQTIEVGGASSAGAWRGLSWLDTGHGSLPGRLLASKS